MTTQHGPTIAEQSKVLLPQIAGYVGHRVIAMGLRTNLVPTLAEMGPTTQGKLADRLDFDPLYVEVWCRAAFSAGVLQRADDKYELAPHMETLLLDTASPAYVGGVFTLLEQPEIFTGMETRLATSERLWWDETSPDFISQVSGTGRPFYTRLIPDGLSRIAGLTEALEDEAVIVDTACGAGHGVIALARAYPSCQVVGVDGDAHSIELARERVAAAELGDQVELVVATLEDLDMADRFTLVINNISMHECRDIDTVAANFKRALKPGGWLAISDFPFPTDDDGLRSVPGRIMSGIQFFEAQIDDQLLPRSAYDDLLERHSFNDIDWFEISPLHAVTHGRA